MSGVRTEVVPVGVLGTIPLRLNISPRTTEVGIPIELIETLALLRSAKHAKLICNQNKMILTCSTLTMGLWLNNDSSSTDILEMRHYCGSHPSYNKFFHAGTNHNNPNVLKRTMDWVWFEVCQKYRSDYCFPRWVLLFRYFHFGQKFDWVLPCDGTIIVVWIYSCSKNTLMLPHFGSSVSKAYFPKNKEL